MFKTKDIISKITVAIGLITIVYSVFIYSSNEKVFDKSNIIEGRLIDYIKNDTGDNLPLILYVVGKDTFRFESSIEIGTFPKENRVKVEYNTENPEEARLYESYKDNGIPISIATIGIMVSILGFIMLYYSWKKQVSDIQ